MKYVSAIIQPSRRNDIELGLAEIGLHDVTVTEVSGAGRQTGRTAIYRGAEYAPDYLPKLKIDITAEERLLDEVIRLIVKVCQTGRLGDGKVFISELRQFVRIRTGENENEAI